LTVPKIKDLVNAPTQKYENILNIISNNTMNSNTSYGDYKIVDLLPKSEEPTMKNELKNFLKKQLNTSSAGTDISALDSMSYDKSYSEFK